MRWKVGGLLVVASVFLMVITVAWMVVGVATFPDDSNEDQRSELFAGVLFFGVLIVLETVLFLTGRWLRRPIPAEASSGGTAMTAAGRPGAWAVYLTCSVAVALLAGFLWAAPESLRFLWLLVGQPVLFTQLLVGGLLGVKLDSGAGTGAIIAAASLLYFLVLFYPVYRLVTMNRAAEPACLSRMKVLLVLFGGVHLLLAAAFAVLSGA